MNELTERQKFLLTLIVHEHIRTAQPVGSQHLVERYHLDMSSATVRNELAALTEMGYLRQPYTSAGRVPTEEGYRYFVGRLIQEPELPDATRRTINHQFHQMHQDVDQWMRLTASVLANQSRAASLVTAPHPELARFKHLELIATRGRQVLMVLVLVGGEIQQRLLTLPESIPQEQLSEIAGRFSQQLEGKPIEAIRALRGAMQNQDLDVLEWVIDEMVLASAATSGEVYLDGLANVLAEPEFAGSEDGRKALKVLEERSVLQDLATRALATTIPGGVQVLIGGEGTFSQLRPFSLVLARYGRPGIVTGTLGVVGPIRMPYARTISTVRFLAGLLSDMVTDTLIE
jgi:heat-inducible transcriptional repressor